MPWWAYGGHVYARTTGLGFRKRAAGMVDLNPRLQSRGRNKAIEYPRANWGISMPTEMA